MLADYRGQALNLANAMPYAYPAGELLKYGARRAKDKLIQKFKGKVQNYRPVKKRIQGPHRRMGYQGNRKPTARKSKAVNSRVVSVANQGGYNQWEEQRGKFRLGKNITMMNQLVRKMKQAETKVLYKYQGVKTFDTNGYYWLSNKTIVDRRNLPFYAFDITSCVNTNDGTTTVQANPLQQAYMVTANGDIGFQDQYGITSDGVGSNLNWTQEQTSGSGIAVSAGLDKAQLPHSKDVLKWVSINFNLWGAKAKSTKYVAQLVTFKDDALLPFSGTGTSSRRTSFYQTLLKKYVFNPISTSGIGEFKKYINVIKSETFSIGPTSTTESDADPHVKTVKWFIRLNKMLDYVVGAQNLATASDFADQADFAINLGAQNGAYVMPTKRVYFILYSTNFQEDSGVDSNVYTPSFDLSIRKAHTHLD